MGSKDREGRIEEEGTGKRIKKKKMGRQKPPIYISGCASK